MVELIREFLDKYIGATQGQSPSEERDMVRIAIVALLIEMTRIDGAIAMTERDRIGDVVQAKFGLQAAETAELMRLAEESGRQATDYFQFTSLLNNRLTPEEKERLIEHLWEVAYVDGELHQYEEHLVRKIADLLHVPHKSFIATKLRIRPPQ